jgi:hypothetical protein
MLKNKFVKVLAKLVKQKEVFLGTKQAERE